MRSVSRRTQQGSDNLRVIKPNSVSELMCDLYIEFEPTPDTSIHNTKSDTER